MCRYVLLRDFEQNKEDPSTWERLPMGSKRHKQYLRKKLISASKRLDKNKASDIEDFSEVLECLHSLAFFSSFDFNDIEQNRYKMLAESGKYLDGILKDTKK